VLISGEFDAELRQCLGAIFGLPGGAAADALRRDRGSLIVGPARLEGQVGGISSPSRRAEK
jgi:hypothetical protein